jgi:hypothetical protein
MLGSTLRTAVVPRQVFHLTVQADIGCATSLVQAVSGARVWDAVRDIAGAPLGPTDRTLRAVFLRCRDIILYGTDFRPSP